MSSSTNTTTKAKRPPLTEHRCAKCGRRLRKERWVYSRHTGNRYCWPGEGCKL